jgi:hypothetical protein
MATKNETRSAPIGIRVTPSVKKAAEKAAAADHRTVASLIEKLLIEHLDGTRWREHKTTPAPQDRPFLAFGFIPENGDRAVTVAKWDHQANFRTVLGAETKHLVVLKWTELPPGPKG